MCLDEMAAHSTSFGATEWSNTVLRRMWYLSEHCPKLSALYLPSCTTSIHIRSIPKTVSSLDISAGRFIDDNCLLELSERLPGLCCLRMGGLTEISSQGVSYLIPGLKNLKSLDLSYCNPLISIPNLSALSDLQCLDLSGNTMVTNKTLLSLPPSLRVLDVASCSAVSDSAFESLFLPSLVSLNLSFCFLITDKAIASIALNFVNLESLNVSCCTQITDKGLSSLPRSLVCLNLEGCSVSDIGMQAVGALPKLKYLNINLCEGVTWTEISVLRKRLISLEQTREPIDDMPVKPPSYFNFELTKGFKLGTFEKDELRRAKERRLWQQQKEQERKRRESYRDYEELKQKYGIHTVPTTNTGVGRTKEDEEWEREQEERRRRDEEWEREKEERRRREEEWEREREERRRREEEWEREREERRRREEEREREWEREKREMQLRARERDAITGPPSFSSSPHSPRVGDKDFSVTLEVVNKGRGGFPSAPQLEAELAKRFEMAKENFGVLFKADEDNEYIWYVVTCHSKEAKDKLLSFKMVKLCGCVLKSRSGE